MSLWCLDCNLPIDEDPWWYDTFAAGMNVGAAVAELTGVVSQWPDAPSHVSAPFHKACLERQLGRRVDS